MPETQLNKPIKSVQYFFIILRSPRLFSKITFKADISLTISSTMLWILSPTPRLFQKAYKGYIISLGVFLRGIILSVYVLMWR